MHTLKKQIENHSSKTHCSRDLLIERAAILQKIRDFFYARNILEVETPLLSEATATDPHLQSIPATFKKIGSQREQTVYLQTSPEYAMKRLLTNGSGCIYQIGKAFRQGEIGTQHNPEFTMLEWYRLGFDHTDLMQEVYELLQVTLGVKKAEWFSYKALFETYLDIEPHEASLADLKKCALMRTDFKENIQQLTLDRDGWLNYLFSHFLEPKMAEIEVPCFVYDFPSSQAALAKIRRDENPPVASRFEVYFKGLELANGFHELTDPIEQRKRFEADLLYRKQNNLPLVPIDESFLAALAKGLPDCAGVALGFDRLVMIALKTVDIARALSFPWINYTL